MAEDPPFPPASRLQGEKLEREKRSVLSIPALSFLFELPVALFVLNAGRQIVYINKKALSILPEANRDNPWGLRPGEAFDCIHICEGSDGCGSSSFCRYCGAARALSKAILGLSEAQECRLERVRDERKEQLELLVWANPLEYRQERFILFSVMDISADKKREAFEQIFLHDLMNTAGSLTSLLRLMESEDVSFGEYLDLARGASEQLTDEILSYRVLSDAEDGILYLEKQTVSLSDLIAAVGATWARIAESRGISFTLYPSSPVVSGTDPVLFKRVLSNLCKNAIEASNRGQGVSLSASLERGVLRIEVHNDAVMKEEVLAQLFKRSFSTKGRGRGLGTYAAKLFVEEYLGGSIRAQSAEGKGTSFIVTLPLDSV